MIQKVYNTWKVRKSYWNNRRNSELGEFEADIREESVAAIDKEHEEEEEIATLLEEEKLLKRFFILWSSFELDEESEPEAPKKAVFKFRLKIC
jgi:hypothetical protein